MMNEQLPQNIEAERQLLGLLFDPYCTERRAILQSDLTPDYFYEKRYATIYEAILTLHKEGVEIDSIPVGEWILSNRPKSQVGFVEIASLLGHVTSISGMYLVQVLRRYYLRRKSILLCRKLIYDLGLENDAPEQLISHAAEVLSGIPNQQVETSPSLIDASVEVMRQVEENLDPKTRHRGSQTGFPQIDETGGLPEVGITVIAADTGQGKSSLGIDLAMQNLRDGEKVGYFSLEMPQEDLARRIVAGMTGIPYHHLAYQPLMPEEVRRVEEALQYLYHHGGERFLFDNHMETTTEGILNTIRRLADPEGEHVTHFYVDYMQILSWAEEGARSRTQTVEQLLASAARAFHNLSVKMKVQIVLLSQVNRDNDNRELSLDRIRDSKQIADAATCVMLLYRPEAYGKNYQNERFRNVDPHGTALIDVAKRRNGPPVKFVCGFDAVRTHFYPLEKVPIIVNTCLTENIDL